MVSRFYIHVLRMPILPFTHVLQVANQIKEELMVLSGSRGSAEGVGWKKVGEKLCEYRTYA